MRNGRPFAESCIAAAARPAQKTRSSNRPPSACGAILATFESLRQEIQLVFLSSHEPTPQALAGVSILLVLFRQLGPAFADEHDRRGFGNHGDIANLQLGQVDTVEHVGKFADESDALH